MARDTTPARQVLTNRIRRTFTHYRPGDAFSALDGWRVETVERLDELYQANLRYDAWPDGVTRREKEQGE
jgi:hypothetical protein